MSNRKKKKTAQTVTPLPPPPSPSERAQKFAEAEAIIRSENLRMSEERRNIKQCPNCGAPYPLVSNICPYCGHVLHEQQGEDFNIRTLIDNINASINTLKNAPKPSFLQVLWYRFDLVSLYFIVVLVIVRLHYLDESYYTYETEIKMAIKYIMFLWFVFGLYSLHQKYIKKTAKNISPLEKANDDYYTALHANERYLRQTETIYGDNFEAKILLEQFAAEIEAAEKVQKSNRLKLTLFIIGFTLIPIILLIVSHSSNS